MRSSVQESNNKVMEKIKNIMGSDNEYCIFSEGESDKDMKKGKKKRKTKHIEKRHILLKGVVGLSTAKERSTISGMQSKKKGVLRGTQEIETLDEELLENEYLKDNDEFVDQYVYDLQQEEGGSNDLFGEDIILSTSKDSSKNLFEEEMFSPHNIKHYWSAEWWPLENMAKYIKKLIKNTFEEEEVKNVLKAECCRLVTDKVCLTQIWILV
ncbi:hypothetical protein NDU88_003854 [Pleurodeles waltl]|uniref:Uncharacterized protein n=1 Tax=Pleurodeles waltl TaxID=8319 RepID=A0AAV7PDD0_PLEWA|nr:hypothetical protein NDU88_003854 [Pleurodeles waltl]